MLKHASLIETGVDKLVKLVTQRRRISIPSAAAALGVSTAVIEEWADFLEEEGIINLEYSFATTYLSQSKAGGKDLLKKAKEFHHAKDILTRNIETALATIHMDMILVHELKNEIFILKKGFGNHAESIGKQIADLEHFAGKKKTLDRKFLNLRGKFRQALSTKVSEKETVLFKSIKELVRKEEETVDQTVAIEKRLGKSFKALFDKREEMEKRIKDIETTYASLGTILGGLLKKIQVSSKGNRVLDSKKYIAELEDAFKKTERDRKLFRNDVKQLMSRVGKYF